MQILKLKANPVGVSPNPDGRFETTSRLESYRYEPVYWTIGLLVDRVPSREELYWRAYPAQGVTTLVGLHASGYARVLQHTPSREEGYAGRELTFPMADGTVRVFKGPWDSSAPAAAGTGAPHLIDVAITTKQEWFEDSLACTSQLELSVAQRLVAQLPGFSIESKGSTYQLVEDTPVTAVLSS